MKLHFDKDFVKKFPNDEPDTFQIAGKDIDYPPLCFSVELREPDEDLPCKECEWASKGCQK